jgi:hypothetical protein
MIMFGQRMRGRLVSARSADSSERAAPMLTMETIAAALLRVSEWAG